MDQAAPGDAVEVAVVGPRGLDFGAYAQLQQESYAALLSEAGVTGHLTAEYFRWKYATDAGEARVAVARGGGRLLAATGMIPQRVSDGGPPVRVWQPVDAATHPDARGRGLWSRCIGALRDDLGDEYVFFGFPNRYAIGGWRKLGWTLNASVDTFVRPFPAGRTASFADVVPQAGNDLDAFAARHAAAAGPAVVRDSAYHRWRYATHPVHRYESFVLRPDADVRGLVVLRRAAVGARQVACVMEAAALDAPGERRLLAFAAAWARERGVSLAVAMGTRTGALGALRAGFVRAPRMLLPKKQVLMGAARGAGPESLWARRWNVQLGDWDAF